MGGEGAVSILSRWLCGIPVGVERICGFTSAVFLARELLLPSLCEFAEFSGRTARTKQVVLEEILSRILMSFYLGRGYRGCNIITGYQQK